MRLYRLKHDDNFKYLTSNNITSFLEGDEEVIEISIYEGKTKKENDKRKDFNITLIEPYIFIQEKIKRLIEELNIKVNFGKTNDKNYYLLTPCVSMKIIDYRDDDDLLEMVFSERFRFNKKLNLDSIYIFKEEKISSMVFFTSEFVDKFKDKLKGAIFEEYKED